jgi:hypothetical protein
VTAHVTAADVSAYQTTVTTALSHELYNLVSHTANPPAAIVAGVI